MNQKRNYIKIGDKVKVITGAQKGFLGNVTSIFTKTSTVIIEGIVPRIKYVKNKQSGETQKTELPILIHISNILLWDNEKKSASRVGYKIINGIKKRYLKKSNTTID
jgi:large subunit ribosomal protein L24